MDLSTFVASLVSSGIISLGVARWLTKRLIDHRLTKDLADHKGAIDEKVGKELADHSAILNDRLATSKAGLDHHLATAKAELDATLRKGVEEYLGERAAERQYQFEARKRLYAAIGPLRFQLVVACSDFAGRIDRIGSGKQSYATTLSGYFGRSTTFRLLRLFAFSELIERQVAYADFSVDPSTINLLHFKNAAFRCMASSTIVLGHPAANWNEQVEHVYWDMLSRIAAVLIVDDGVGTPARTMRFDEFDKFVSTPENLEAIHPIPTLMDGFSITAKPILWIRFVALAHLCTSFLEREGPPLGITAEAYDGAAVLRTLNDDYVQANYESFCGMLQSVVSTGQIFGSTPRKPSSTSPLADPPIREPLS